MSAEGGRPPELQVSGVTKGYLGVQALKGVDLAVARGSIHALAGQNGAGKSTLVKILSGAESPDSGTISVGGDVVRLRSPQDAQAAGIQTIYQELSLVPQLSVAENILLGQLPRTAFPGIDWPTMRRRAAEALDRVGFALDVREPVGNYSVAEQQGVELAKALHKDARVLLLDEPTSALPPPDVQRLFRVLKDLAGQGMTMLYISHRMEELYELCDAVSVLRDGALARTFATADSAPAEVVSAMVGKSLAGSLAEAALSGERSPRLGPGHTGTVLMSVRDVAADQKLRDISFDLHEGEVLGIAGLVGSGQSELAAVLAGARARDGGTIALDGRPVALASPREAIRAGIGLLPQDRKAHGFIPEMSVAGNITLASLPMFSRLSVRSDRRENAAAQQLAERLDMKIAGVGQPMKTLSGGTQQKAILARWLVRSARILICDEPTRGVDVGAKEDMYELLRDFARDGGTVIVASSELSEAMMCDRVLVMAGGRIVAELDHDEIDPHGEAIIQRFG
ncbi:sugar ABC transporter ATP-binding protein [Pseudonocardia kunmingensis]|uniref:sugar ABC transporter ATP-binding protein n=1 Tax=Pseudonocardia kunmingensis TaxID=630975 RepID=UPI001B8687CC|nr:sugar ABC transporter ATP-binding protein [Pseudonocardia kunmingensis]